jgi:hypothetical protein
LKENEMLSGQLIRSGNLRDYTPLGGVGYPVYAAAAQIRTAIARQLGQQYADFLAIPQFDSKGETIDWYAAADGDIVPWQAASESERNLMRQRVGELCAAIENHAKQIQASPRSNDQLVFGRLLELCTRIPDESHLYLINGKPLVTFWGFVRAGADTSKHVLSDLPGVAAASPAPPAAGIVETPSEPERRRPWWWWLLWLLLLLLLLALLLFGLRSCSAVQPYVPLLPGFLQDIVQEPKEEPAPVIGPDGKVIVPGNGVVIGPDGKVIPGTGVTPGPGSEALPGVTGNGAIEGVPPAGEGTSPEGTSPETTPPNPDQSGAEQKPEGDQQPDQQTPPDQQAPEQQAPDQQTPDQQTPDQQNQKDQQSENPDQQKQGDQGKTPGEQPPAADNTPPIKPIEIPDAASSKNDPSFMEGDWRSKTGLVAKNAKGPVTMDYKFDKSGKGTTTLRMQNGVTCSGPSTASTANGKLTVQDQGQLTCSNGQTFAGSTVTCAKDASGQTKCTGRYPNGQTYDIILGR